MKSPQNHYQQAESSFKWNSEVTLKEKMILISKFQLSSMSSENDHSIIIINQGFRT